MATTTTVDPQKFDVLEATLNRELVERSELIQSVVQALVGRSTFFMLGVPGTAKSMLPNRLFTYIEGANHFELLLTKFTKDTEIFGPTSLAGLENDELYRLIEGYLPTAHSAFLDEVFKASSAILNTLLTIINERKYRHKKEMIKVPLGFFGAASNEPPQDESLNALYDRLIVRHIIEPIRDQASFLTMLRTDIPENPDPVLNWDEVLQAQDEATKVIVPEDVLEAVAELRKRLRDQGIEPSERRFVQSLRIIRATAWLDGCHTADIEHLTPLKNILWTDPEQIPNIQEAVLSLANPLEVEANRLFSDINELDAQLDSVGTDDDKIRIGNEVNGRLRRCKVELDDLEKRAGGNPRRLRRIEEVKDRLVTVTDRVLTEVFGFADAEAQRVINRKND